MRTDDFDFDLPENLIAQEPATPRDSARLLVVADRLADRCVADLPDLLAPGDLLVLNDTRVIPARLRGRRGAASVEITLHRPLDDGRWRVFAKPAWRLKPGDRVEFAPGFHAEAIGTKRSAGPNVT